LKNVKWMTRVRRHKSIRKAVSGTAVRPRLAVFRSARHIYAQIVDDEVGLTLASASSLDDLPLSETGKKAVAFAVGQLLASRAASAGVVDVVFDRGGFVYHGRVASLAEGARQFGLRF